jgi:DNA (cytosine-5)-methyltransferase 1
LFAGIGGFDLGFERQGYEIRWQVEKDRYCQRVLQKHWPLGERFEDVRDCGAHNLTPVDVITGGFPCQDVSDAGKRAGINGDRSGLWSEMCRIIGELRPRFVLVENVPGLFVRGIDRVLGDLAEIGYDAEWQVISAADVGAPHLRKRVWIVAHHHDITARKQELRAERQIPPVVAGDGRAQSVALPAGKLCNGINDNIGDGQRSQKVLEFGDSCGRANEDFPFEGAGDREWEYWATEPDVGRVAHGIPNGVDRLKGLGNAIVPQIAEHFALALKPHLVEVYA